MARAHIPARILRLIGRGRLHAFCKLRFFDCQDMLIVDDLCILFLLKLFYTSPQIGQQTHTLVSLSAAPLVSLKYILQEAAFRAAFLAVQPDLPRLSRPLHMQTSPRTLFTTRNEQKVYLYARM